MKLFEMIYTPNGKYGNPPTPLQKPTFFTLTPRPFHNYSDPTPTKRENVCSVWTISFKVTPPPKKKVLTTL